MLSLDACILKSGKIPWRIIEQEAILVDVKGGNVMQMNEVGAFIWSQINGEKSARRIIDSVCEAFEADKDRIKKDTLEFLSELLKRRIIKVK